MSEETETPAPSYRVLVQAKPAQSMVYLAIMEDAEQLAWITFDDHEQVTGLIDRLIDARAWTWGPFPEPKDPG